MYVAVKGGERAIELDQPGRGDRGRGDTGEKVRRHGRITVLEGKLHRHATKIGAPRRFFEPKTGRTSVAASRCVG